MRTLRYSRGNKEYVTITGDPPTAKQTVEIKKTVNLNRSIDDQELQNMHISTRTAEMLLLQNEDTIQPRTEQNSLNRAAPPESGFQRPTNSTLLSQSARPVTPNPFYHHQKRKLLIKYKQQLVEEEMKQRLDDSRLVMQHFESNRLRSLQRRSQESRKMKALQQKSQEEKLE